jgi:hypothetical protein
MAHVLAVCAKDIAPEFVAGFQGMTAEAVTVEQLVAVGSTLVDSIVTNMPQHHRRILVSLASGAPDRSLLAVPNADWSPAVKWRRQNLARNSHVKLFRQGELESCSASCAIPLSHEHARHGARHHATCWGRIHRVPDDPRPRAHRPRLPDAGREGAEDRHWTRGALASHRQA